jgi:hypothetical protein
MSGFPDDGNPRFIFNEPITRDGLLYFSFAAKLYWTCDRPIDEWCIGQYGPSDSPTRPEGFRWKRTYQNHFLIRDNADAMLFKLRWC